MAVTIVHSRQSTLEMQRSRLERILLDGAKRHKVSASVGGLLSVPGVWCCWGEGGRKIRENYYHFALLDLKHPEATRESHSQRPRDRFHQKQETQLKQWNSLGLCEAMQASLDFLGYTKPKGRPVATYFYAWNMKCSPFYLPPLSLLGQSS